MTNFLYILIPAILSIYIWKLIFKHEITLKEMLISAGITLVTSLVLLGGLEASKYANMYDTEVLNGLVTGKEQVRVSCRHDYSCNCRMVTSGSGKNATTSMVCDTCYEHTNDWDWDVHTTVGTSTIDRIDRRGVEEPPRFSEVVVGEPAANTHSYINYLKGSKDSLFYLPQESLKEWEGKIPKYPYVYDYYRSNKVFNGTTVDAKGYNDYITNRLRTMGKEKQVNIVVFLTNEKPQFFNAVLTQWGGIKKNDVFMMFGIKEGKVQWFNSTSFADGMNNKELHIKMRNNALNKTMELGLLKEQVDLVESDFTRLPNEKFKYIVENIQPKSWAVLLCIFINLLITGFVSYNMANNYEREGVTRYVRRSRKY